MVLLNNISIGMGDIYSIVDILIMVVNNNHCKKNTGCLIKNVEVFAHLYLERKCTEIPG